MMALVVPHVFRGTYLDAHEKYINPDGDHVKKKPYFNLDDKYKMFICIGL